MDRTGDAGGDSLDKHASVYLESTSFETFFLFCWQSIPRPEAMYGKLVINRPDGSDQELELDSTCPMHVTSRLLSPVSVFPEQVSLNCLLV